MRVRVAEPPERLTADWLNVTDGPDGATVAERLTVPVKPLLPVTRSAEFVDCPERTVIWDGLVDNVKDCDASCAAAIRSKSFV